MSIFDFWTEILAVDPGSHSLRIAKKANVIFNEPSTISWDVTQPADAKINGFGKSTSTDRRNVIIRPTNYVIRDFHAFEMMLRAAIRSGTNPTSVFPKAAIMYISVPTNCTEVEKRAYRDSAEHANAKEVYLIYQSVSAAIGMNLLFEKKDFLLVDFSYSKIEITAFVNSVIFASSIMRIGVHELTELIKNSMRRSYDLIISNDEAYNILRENDWVNPQNEITVSFRRVSSQPIYHVINSALTLMKDQILKTFEEIEKSKKFKNVVENGTYFTGGGSILQSLVKMIIPDLNIKNTFSSNPLLDNVNGLKKVLENTEHFKDYLMV